MATQFTYTNEDYDLHGELAALAFSMSPQWKISTSTHWSTDIEQLPPWETYKESHNSYAREFLFKDGDGALLLHLRNDGMVNLTARCKSLKWFDAWVQKIRVIWTEVKATDDTVPVKISYNSPRGPSSWTRNISFTAWNEAKKNYAPKVRESLDELMTAPPGEGGKLLLWQGVPGTGKTHAIRSLMHAWRGRANFIYITDPEKFFGDHPEYMMQIILESEPSRMRAHAVGDDEDDDSFIKKKEEDPVLVVVLEDSGELLAHDAKDRVGQGLSRLLNLVDGIIGQGLKLLLLITTNEKITTFHPAVIRPGRCVQAIEFEPLDTKESLEWLKSHGCNEPPQKASTIAELYQILNGWRDNSMEAKVTGVQYA